MNRTAIALVLALGGCSAESCRSDSSVPLCAGREALAPALRGAIEGEVLARVDDLRAGRIESVIAAAHPILAPTPDDARIRSLSTALSAKPSDRAPVLTDVRVLSWSGRSRRTTAPCGTFDETESYLRFTGDLPEGTRLALVIVELPRPDLSRRLVVELWEHEGAFKLAQLDLQPSFHGALRASDYLRLAEDDAAAGDPLSRAIHLGAASALAALSPRVKSGVLLEVENASRELPGTASNPGIPIGGEEVELSRVRLHLFDDALAPVVELSSRTPWTEASLRAMANAAFEHLRRTHPQFFHGFSLLVVEGVAADANEGASAGVKRVLVAVDES